MTDTPNLQLAVCKVSVQHLAQYSQLSDAESLLKVLRETVAFLERRIAREKIDVAKQRRVGVLCAVEGNGSRLTT